MLKQLFLWTEAYHKFLEAYGLGDSEARTRAYLQLFSQLPQNPNQACIVFLMEHLVRCVNKTVLKLRLEMRSSFAELLGWSPTTRCHYTTSQQCLGPPCFTLGRMIRRITETYLPPARWMWWPSLGSSTSSFPGEHGASQSRSWRGHCSNPLMVSCVISLKPLSFNLCKVATINRFSTKNIYQWFWNFFSWNSFDTEQTFNPFWYLQFLQLICVILKILFCRNILLYT